MTKLIFQNQLFQEILSGTLSERHAAWILIKHSVRPDLSPNCLHRLFADNKSLIAWKELRKVFA